MKTKKQVFFLIALLGGVLAIVSLFLKSWAFDANGEIAEKYTYSLFQSVAREVELAFETANKNYVGIWSILYSIAAALGIVSFAGFLVLRLMKSNNNAKIASLATVICGIVALVFGIIYTSVNTVKIQMPLIGDYVYSMKGQAGFFMLCAGLILSGVFGMLLSSIKTPRKRKK